MSAANFIFEFGDGSNSATIYYSEQLKGIPNYAAGRFLYEHESELTQGEIFRFMDTYIEHIPCKISGETKISAIKQVRMDFGCGVGVAKAFVDSVVSFGHDTVTCIRFEEMAKNGFKNPNVHNKPFYANHQSIVRTVEDDEKELAAWMAKQQAQQAERDAFQRNLIATLTPEQKAKRRRSLGYACGFGFPY